MVVISGMMLLFLGGVILANMGLYDPITSPDHNAHILWGFWAVMAVAYVPVYRAIAKKDSGQVQKHCTGHTHHDD